MSKVVTAGLTVAGVPYGEDVRAGDLVGWSGGRLVRACGSAGNPVPAVGIAAASYKADESGAMHLVGEISGLSGLTVGGMQYLSLSTPGSIQGSVPSGTGNLKQAVGYAVAGDRVAVVIRDQGTYL